MERLFLPLDFCFAGHSASGAMAGLCEATKQNIGLLALIALGFIAQGVLNIVAGCEARVIWNYSPGLCNPGRSWARDRIPFLI